VIASTPDAVHGLRQTQPGRLADRSLLKKIDRHRQDDQGLAVDDREEVARGDAGGMPSSAAVLVACTRREQISELEANGMNDIEGLAAAVVVDEYAPIRTGRDCKRGCSVLV
jgi:hypothetical protein